MKKQLALLVALVTSALMLSACNDAIAVTQTLVTL